MTLFKFILLKAYFYNCTDETITCPPLLLRDIIMSLILVIVNIMINLQYMYYNNFNDHASHVNLLLLTFQWKTKNLD